MLAKVKGLQQGQPKGDVQEQEEGRSAGGWSLKQSCNKYTGDITQKILDAAEGCTGGGKEPDRQQTGRSGSKQGGP